MTLTTVLFILISIAVAACLSFYQYFYKAGSRSKINLLLAFLRFLSLFGLLLLLINPKITRTSYEVQKTPLAVVIDNSSSITDLKADKIARDFFDKIGNDKRINEKFDVQKYRFDNSFDSSDSITFTGAQTNISQVAQNLNDINRNRLFPTVLITDGNQTSGSDYVYSFSEQNKVFPIVVGDTTTFTDLRIVQVNVNKYAFLKNKFPAEVFVQYAGKKSTVANVTISNGTTVVHRENIAFSPNKKSAVIHVLLPASSVGLQIYRAAVSSNEVEKNVYNNAKNFAVEIIDQKSEVAIVSTINHPDIGALKRAIETNAQRKVTIVRPENIGSISAYNVLLLYQPTRQFQKVVEAAKLARVNAMVITGLSTDFAFLNEMQSNLKFKMSAQREEYTAGFDPSFNLFAMDNIGFEAFGPLSNPFGTTAASNTTSVLLHAKISNIDSGNPLLCFSESGNERAAFLLGENIWKWRMQSFLASKSFEKFDIFVDKIIQYLSSNAAKKSLIVTHESFYNSGDPIKIDAQYFNKNYEFDEKARLAIVVTDRNSKLTKRYDLVRNNSTFSVNLDGLSSGKYNFTVTELNSNTKYSGNFEILDFDIEKQFVNPDLAKLQQLAARTDAAAFMPNQYERVVERLVQDTKYRAVQKPVVRTLPLIDSVMLLVIIVILFCMEWLLRKYHGML